MTIREIIYGPHTNDYDAEVQKLADALFWEAISAGAGQTWVYRAPDGSYRTYSTDRAPADCEFIGCLYNSFYDDFWLCSNTDEKNRLCRDTADDLFTELDQ